MHCPKFDSCPIAISSRQSITEYEEKLSRLKHIRDTHMPAGGLTSAVIAVDSRHVDTSARKDDVSYFTPEQLTRDISSTEKVIQQGYRFIANLEANCSNGQLAMRAKKDDTMYTVRVCTSSAVPNEPGEPVQIIRQSLSLENV